MRRAGLCKDHTAGLVENVQREVGPEAASPTRKPIP